MRNARLHPDVLDLTFQGWACLYRGRKHEILVQARGFFQRALTLDPDNVLALLGLAAVDLFVGISFLGDDPAANLTAAEAAANKAVSQSPNYALAHLMPGAVYDATNRAVQAIIACEHTLGLDPNLATAHAEIGAAKVLLGRAEETEAHIGEAFRFSPRDNLGYAWMYVAGIAQGLLGDDEKAVVFLRRWIEANPNPNWSVTHFHLASALANLGKLDKARTAAQTGLALDPNFTIRRASKALPSNYPTYLAQLKRIGDGMRLAGSAMRMSARRCARLDQAIDSSPGTRDIGECSPRCRRCTKCLLC